MKCRNIKLGRHHRSDEPTYPLYIDCTSRFISSSQFSFRVIFNSHASLNCPLICVHKYEYMLRFFREKLSHIPQCSVSCSQYIVDDVRRHILPAMHLACWATTIHDKILGFTDGYNSKVGNQGLKLSSRVVRRPVPPCSSNVLRVSTSKQHRAMQVSLPHARHHGTAR
ncbi:hypothetical protein ONS96_006850 [Cadophora gregata f. sp. sojae]|nr:hypothetical protein ONS96_006850 [Cadophora gregata f. sp. sojae]